MSEHKHRPIAEIEADLKREGERFNELTGVEYIDLGDGEMWNAKEASGHAIYKLYAELGAAMEADGK